MNKKKSASKNKSAKKYNKVSNKTVGFIENNSKSASNCASKVNRSSKVIK